MRALLDLLHDNEAAVQDLPKRCEELLLEAARHLKILDQEHGDQDLIASVAEKYAKLSWPRRQPETGETTAGRVAGYRV